MKTVTLYGVFAAVLAFGAFAVAISGSDGRAVVTITPVTEPLVTPRVRVTNDRNGPVDVWYRTEESGVRNRLGLVQRFATETYELSLEDGPIQLIVRPAGTQNTSFITERLDLNSKSDVSLRVDELIDRSTVVVTELDVVHVMSSR